MRHWFAASIAFAALVPALPAGAAWFSDNGDREALPLLRARAGDSPDPTERALLDAANRIGWVQIPECGWGSNAVLVNIAGQDYAITSLHLLTGKGPGDVHCAPGLAATYIPNAAYRRPETGPEDSPEWLSFVTETVDLAPEPLNFTGAGAAMPWVHDWVAYRLEKNVSDQIMPEGAWGAGKPRGSVRWSARQNPTGPVWVIGYDGRFGRENGWQFSWQQCQQRKNRMDENRFYISCDISPGASSSLIGTMEDGELTLQGIVTASMERFAGTDVPLPDSTLLWNIGTSSVSMQEELDPAALPAEESSGWGAVVMPWRRAGAE